jgi:hypothetical protein
MLVEAKTFCRAHAGILYLREEQDLKYVIYRDDEHSVVLGGTTGKPVPFATVPLLDRPRANPIAATLPCAPRSPPT